MKNISLFLLVMLCLSSCGEKSDETTLSGEIAGLGNDTIRLFGINEFTDIDTLIFAKDNKFSIQIKVDSITQALLLFKNQQKHPIYFDKKEHITIRGDIGQPGFLEIKGSQANEDLTRFFRETKGQPTDSIRKKATEFIHTHPSSIVSIYILDRYFVQKINPDMQAIKELIDGMDGDLQDMAYITDLSAVIEQYGKVEVNKTTPNFSFTNAGGKKINRYDYRNKYILLNFWASWSDSCRTANSQLKQLHKKYKKEENLVMIGVSLDVDKLQWKQTLKDDTLAWEQVSDLQGWSSEAVKQFNIPNVPYNILIDKSGKILSRGIQGEELTNYLDKLLKKDK